MTVLCVHRQKPNWTATKERPRFELEIDGCLYWAETDGDKPDPVEVLAVINGRPGPAPEPDEYDELLATIVATLKQQEAEIAMLHEAMAKLVEAGQGSP